MPKSKLKKSNTKAVLAIVSGILIGVLVASKEIIKLAKYTYSKLRDPEVKKWKKGFVVGFGVIVMILGIPVFSGTGADSGIDQEVKGVKEDSSLSQEKEEESKKVAKTKLAEEAKQKELEEKEEEEQRQRIDDALEAKKLEDAKKELEKIAEEEKNKITLPVIEVEEPSEPIPDAQEQVTPPATTNFFTEPVVDPVPATTPAPTPEPVEMYDNCADVEAAGLLVVNIGEPGYGPHLDNDGDGIGCEVETEVTPGNTTVEPEVYYANCTAVRNAGANPILIGQPGYGTHLDKDGDGRACE